ncbi:proton-associated sugar transporter A-like [Paramacrobiotus metropolitanus]|uniref:proton-associated sugar transporter A-like n=1 Tax=Paramacrobiotus metropolitanus TaxID=2943436 RepID=UPI002445AF1C|nr:proton-associated sugar transporter A-like [Paramacrobiotus metropolitanus]
MDRSGNIGWFGIPADAFQDIQQRTFSRLQELGEWTQDRYRSIVDASLHFSDPRYQHLYQRKSRLDLIRLSACVCGIEFCYAAETAFVSPTLLKIGIPVRLMTLIWCLSPAIGFFLVPFLGSCSDRCQFFMGRRRPFIILLSFGIIIGLALVPHGASLGYLLGDRAPLHRGGHFSINETLLLHNKTLSLESDTDDVVTHFRPIGIFFTILGVMCLDLCADSCQSPSRAYLLDVSLPEDHGRGLSTFTFMAGLGGGLGYVLGAIHWEHTALGAGVGGQEAAVFLIVLIIYLICLAITITSFREMPLKDIEARTHHQRTAQQQHNNPVFEPAELDPAETQPHRAGDAINNGFKNYNVDFCEVDVSDFAPLHVVDDSVREEAALTIQDYLWSIIYMPKSLRVLCLTNLCCWMSLVCYSLYFTDFVGQSVFGGDPTAVAANSAARHLYEEGIRFGCWGMAIYSVSCSCYSAIIERLILKWGAKRIYISGQLIYTVGMLLMAIIRTKPCVIIFSASAGIMYSTLFTMPFFLVAHYHSSGLFEEEQSITAHMIQHRKHVRGLGTDVATVSSMVFLAQFILSGLNGSLVHFTGTPTSTVVLSAVLSFCGALAATQVTYVNL